MLSLSAAAKRANVSKATIHRAIKNGKVSAVRNDDGSYQIDLAELGRVYPAVLKAEDGSGDETPETAAKPVPNGSGETIRNAQRNAHETRPEAVLKAELDGARELIKQLRDQVDDLKGDRDGWRQQAEAAQRLLTHEREQAAPKRPWWKRLAG